MNEQIIMWPARDIETAVSNVNSPLPFSINLMLPLSAQIISLEVTQSVC